MSTIQLSSHSLRGETLSTSDHGNNISLNVGGRFSQHNVGVINKLPLLDYASEPLFNHCFEAKLYTPKPMATPKAVEKMFIHIFFCVSFILQKI